MTAVSPHALLQGLRGRGGGSQRAASSCLYFISVVHSIAFGTGLGEGKRGTTTGLLRTNRSRCRTVDACRTVCPLPGLYTLHGIRGWINKQASPKQSLSSLFARHAWAKQ